MLVLLGALFVAAAANVVHAQGGELIVGLSSEPPNLDPHIQSGTAARAVKLQFYRGLMAYSPDGSVQPEMAESWEQVDATTYMFTLRDNIRFHSGNRATADDVVYSFQRILNPETGAELHGLFTDIIDNVQALDERTVYITLKQPYAPFIHWLATPEAAIVEAAWSEGRDLRNEVNGTGPFRLAEFERGVRIVAEKHDGFYKPGLPYLDRVVFRFYPDEDLRVRALRSGDVDFIDYVPWKDVEALMADDNVVYDAVEGPFMYLIFNTTREPFNDVRVRHAIAYAINREAIVDVAFFGRGSAMYGLATTPEMLGYDEELNNYFSYDPQKAKALLEEAGYGGGFDMTLLATSQYGMHEQTAQVVFSDLRRLGINVRLLLPDWPTRVDLAMKGDFDVAVQGSAGDTLDPDFYTRFFYTAPPRIANSPWFSDEAIDTLLGMAAEETRPEVRAELYQEFQKRALDLSPLVFLAWREQGVAYRTTVRGFENLPGFVTFFAPITFEKVQVVRD